jgi:hypothetical protein
MITYKYDGEPLECLARTVEFLVMSTDSWDVNFAVVKALSETRPFIDQFPDWEVDRLFAAELKKSIGFRSQRLMAIRTVLGNRVFKDSWSSIL